MPVTMTFQNAINTSLQVGDEIFYIPTSVNLTGGFTTTQTITPAPLVRVLK